MSYPGYPQQGFPGGPPPPMPGYPGSAAHSPQPPYPGAPGQTYLPPAGPPPPIAHGPPAQGISQGGSGVQNIETSGNVEGVQYRIAYRDSNSMLSLRLQPGVEIKGRPGAMVAMDASVKIKGKLKFSFKKMLTGGEMSESIFTGPGEVLLAPETWGDIVPIIVDGSVPWNFSKHAFLASTIGVQRGIKSQSLGKAFFSGEGLFVQQAQGRGVVFVQSLGAIVQRQLGPGEQWVVDNGHLVAWTAQYKVERIQAGGLFSAAHTDEGLVCRFTGPGTVYIQTRNADALIDWIKDQLPSNSSTVIVNN